MLFVSRTMWSTPFSRATSTVRSVDPSSMISHSTDSKPATSRGRSASVTGRVSSSFRHGIWMMSFIGRRLPTVPARHPVFAHGSARPSHVGGRARVRRLDADPIARIAFGLLCVAAVIAFFAYPTYPNYDSYYSLLWGREVLDLQLPGFEGFRVPTEHPLAIVAGALLSLFGRSGDRMFIAMILASFLWLIWGVYKLGRVSFTPLVGGVAALLTLHALRLRLPRRPRLHRHPVHGAGRVGGGARGGAPAARRAGAHHAGARRAAAPGGVGAGRAVLAVDGVAGDLAAADRATPRWPRSARSCGR